MNIRYLCKDYAVAAYQMGNDSPEFDALITSDAGTGVQKRSYLENLSGSRQDLVDALNTAKLKAESVKEFLLLTVFRQKIQFLLLAVLLYL